MQLHYWWWIAALLFGIAELFTGNFFLLVLGLGIAAGGLVAWAGGTLTAQIVGTAIVTLTGWALLWRHQRRQRGPAPLADRNMVLDVGERLRVEAWTGVRSTQARYRGASWSVELDAPLDTVEARAGEFVIVRVDGSRLIVRPAD
jgi:membrane protein implicated in regulation of membrane protease activity